MRTLLFLLASSGPVSMEGEVLETRLRVSLREEAPLRARFRCQLELANEARELGLSFLEIGDARVRRLEVAQRGRLLPLSFEPSDSRLRHAVVELPRPHGGTLDLDIGYEIEGALEALEGGFLARVPVPVLDVPQASARADGFHAAVELPRGYELVESFPAGFDRVSSSTFAVTSPLVPAFLTLRASAEGRILTFGRAVDAGVLVLLAGLGALGLRRGLRPRG